MLFKEGAPVYTANGKEAGRVDRVVINPATKEVTHLVVRKGFLFTEDKVVPIELVESASETGVTLHSQDKALSDLPAYEETFYIPVEEADDATKHEVTTTYAPTMYLYPPFGAPLTGVPSGYNPGLVARVERNIPDDEVALKKGAHLYSSDDKHVGDVEEVLADSRADGKDERATHVVISQGVLFKAHKLIPIDWVSEVNDNDVRLSVNARTLEALPDYDLSTHTFMRDGIPTSELNDVGPGSDLGNRAAGVSTDRGGTPIY
jgi:uncharacterized protein YrrD